VCASARGGCNHPLPLHLHKIYDIKYSTGNSNIYIIIYVL
jgi:hypothetical protein